MNFHIDFAVVTNRAQPRNDKLCDSTTEILGSLN